MPHNFDEIIERRSSGCFKWNQYEADVLPMTVADMDFRGPAPIIEALRQRANHGIFGYEWPREDLLQLICDRMKRVYNWSVLPEEVVVLPGLRVGLSLVCAALSDGSNAAITFTPVYPPFFGAATSHGMASQTVPLKMIADGAILRYEMDLERFEAALTKSTKLLQFCNPHNPVGRAFTPDEMRQIGEICLKHDMVICSDEIHCDLLMGDTKHKPFACISPEISDRCITLMSPSKTFNISGLGAAYAIVQNRDLRHLFKKKVDGVHAEINMAGIATFKAAYKDCNQWLTELLQYLLRNRDLYLDFVLNNLPGIKTTVPEATYLTWLDCRQLSIEGNPYQFFLQNARVALNDGVPFGEGGEGFVRFNFACPRSQMISALEKMQAALLKAGLVANRVS
jgi:cystathionine beta-lyase